MKRRTFLKTVAASSALPWALSFSRSRSSTVRTITGTVGAWVWVLASTFRALAAENINIKVIAIFGQITRGTEQHCRMAIMTTGVH